MFHFHFQFSDLESKKSFLQKRKKKNIRNVLRETHLPPKPKSHLLVYNSKRSGSLEDPRSHSYKKERKRTLETFSKKLLHQIPTYQFPIPRDPGVQRVQEAVPTKKKEKER